VRQYPDQIIYTRFASISAAKDELLSDLDLPKSGGSFSCRRFFSPLAARNFTPVAGRGQKLVPLKTRAEA